MQGLGGGSAEEAGQGLAEGALGLQGEGAGGGGVQVGEGRGAVHREDAAREVIEDELRATLRRLLTAHAPPFSVSRRPDAKFLFGASLGRADAPTWQVSH